jgi:hypothetical protein
VSDGYILLTFSAEEVAARGIESRVTYLRGNGCEVVVTPIGSQTEILANVPRDSYERVLKVLLTILGWRKGVTIVGVPPSVIVPVDRRPRCVRCTRIIDVAQLESELANLTGARGSLQGVTIVVTCPSCGHYAALHDPHPDHREVRSETAH